MQNLAIFLIRLQTFELRIITKTELKSPIKEDGNKLAYSLAHETHYYDSFTYKSEIRVLKDMSKRKLGRALLACPYAIATGVSSSFQSYFGALQAF